MRRIMRNPHGLKVRCYAAHLIDLNEYLALFPGVNLTDKIGMTDLNGVLLNIMPNSWIKQSCVQKFYYKSITFKRAINMFERKDIAESIC